MVQREGGAKHKGKKRRSADAGERAGAAPPKGDPNSFLYDDRREDGAFSYFLNVDAEAAAAEADELQAGQQQLGASVEDDDVMEVE